MPQKYPIFTTVRVDRIFLDLDNPRHVPFKNQAEVIEYLCREEDVYALARDIAKHGLNPIEQFAVLPNKSGGKSETYIVAEGNRRMCAIKLLHDPDLAPPQYRKGFYSLNEGTTSISEVRSVVFENRESVHMWLDRIHGGEQGGIGRRSWNSEQKTRHMGDKKNIVAQGVLDYAEKHKFLTSEDRKRKLTTAQRYLGNVVLREAIGIDARNIEDISRTRPKPDFDHVLKKFVTDLLNNTVHSRANSQMIVDYSRELSFLDGLSSKRIDPESLQVDQNSLVKKRTRKIHPSLVVPQMLEYSKTIDDKLKAIPSYKLQSLYYSVCSIELEKHTPLLSIGVWAFFESLTARLGRDGNTSFEAFLNSRLQSYGFEKKDVKPIKEALERILKYGNTTKHHDEAANFNGTQLHNDMNTLTLLVTKLADQAKLTK